MNSSFFRKTEFRLTSKILLSVLLVASYQNCAKIDYKMAASEEAPANLVSAMAANPDSDHDGLPNNIENLYGTNSDNPDTDGDGLSDGAEIMHHGTDPLKADSDGGGVPDGTEVNLGRDPLNADDDVDVDVVTAAVDSDQDGLSDTDEGNLGTNPQNPDTDGDGLKDGAEINSYHTDPLLADTDKGGVNDGDEIAFGTNPLDPKDDFTKVCTIDSSGGERLTFQCPREEVRCNNGNGNGTEACSPSQHGNNDEKSN